jgi:hypothetical protein
MTVYNNPRESSLHGSSIPLEDAMMLSLSSRVDSVCRFCLSQLMTGRAECLRRNHDVPQCHLFVVLHLGTEWPDCGYSVSGLNIDRLVQLTNIRLGVIRLQLALG